MSNVRQKPIAALAFTRGGRGFVPELPSPPVEIPEAPAGIGEYAADAWEHFWRTPVSGLVDLNRDGERLRHWCRCVDQRHRLWTLWQSAPVIWDTNKELRTNPIYRQVIGLSLEIERAETHFGMTPLAKMRLTGALDQADRAETSIKARRESRRPELVEAGPNYIPWRAKPPTNPETLLR